MKVEAPITLEEKSHILTYPPSPIEHHWEENFTKTPSITLSTLDH